MDPPKSDPDSAAIIQTMAMVISDIERMKHDIAKYQPKKREKEEETLSIVNIRKISVEKNCERPEVEVKGTTASSRIRYSVSICCCLVTILAAFFVYGLVIFLARSTAEGPTVKKTEETEKLGCGADSFMINDGVCDEATNNEKCLYDGDDCCIRSEDIDTSLCRDCVCKLNIKDQDLNKKFKDYRVNIYFDSEGSDKSFKAVKVVNNVASEEVCAELCLPGEESRYSTQEADIKVDSWIYDGTSPNRTCACTRMEVCYNRENVVTINHYKKHCQLKVPVKRYIMLSETVDCGKLGNDRIVKTNCE